MTAKPLKTVKLREYRILNTTGIVLTVKLIKNLASIAMPPVSP